MYQCGTTGTITLLLVLNHLRQLTYTNTTTPAINTKSINVGQHGTDSYHTTAPTSTKTTILAFLTSRAGRIPMRLEGDGEVSYLPTRLPRTSYIILRNIHHHHQHHHQHYRCHHRRH